MKYRVLLFGFFLFVGLINTENVFAQEGQATQTHAEATSQKWKGIDVHSVVIGNSAYEDLTTSGYPFLLYNVGTGRFIIQGGDWAMEGRLFFPDFGRQMYLHSNGRINSGITESQNADKNSFCARPPEPFGKNWQDDTYNKINLTTLMDGNEQVNKYSMCWSFERVVDPSDPETFTYYMYQSSKSKYNIYAGKNFYLGAAWGECHNTSAGKGDGRFVYYDDDRSCWTTVNVQEENAIKAVPSWETTTEDGVYLKQENGKAMLANGDLVDIQKLYQWRLISVDEFIEVLTQNSVGLNPSISSLIKDRDFTRNSNDFFEDNEWLVSPLDANYTGGSHWTVSPLRGYSYATGTKRYTYTWGDYRKGQTNLKQNNQQSRNPRAINEPWDSPVKLKEVFDKVTSSSTDDQPAGKKNAKYGFLPFEGVGTITTNFEAPKPGWYQIECVGFSMSENDNNAYLFARVIPNSRVNDLEKEFEIPSANEPHYGEIMLEKLPFGTYSKNNYENCLVVGKELLKNADNHKQKVWVLVSQEDYDNGNRTIRLGFRKEKATRSELIGSGNNKGYYDTDWVCVDDIRASYMGLAPVFFYEDEEDLSYLSHAQADRENFLANEYTPANWDGRYAGAACLQRKFTLGEWNTFSFPLPLTGEQVRNAFGDDCELLILNSIGNLSNNDCIIDFETVNLLSLDNVVTAGNLYMLKPTKEPAFGENPRGEMADYYDLGKLFFSTDANDNGNPNYTYPFMDLSIWNGKQNVGSFIDKNDGCGYVTYIQTPHFSSFRVDSDGAKLASVDSPDESYAPKGSYAMSGGKMYELSRDTRIKGFRGWIILAHSIFDDAASSAVGARIAIDGVIDGDETNAIDQHTVVPVNPNAISAVYDLSGRKVGTSIEGLPKGMYIVEGKKLLVK